MNEPEPPIKPKPSEKKANAGSSGVKILFAVLIVWTLLIAAGSFFPPSSDNAHVKIKDDGQRSQSWKQPTTDFRRPLILGLTMGTFLSVWALALKSKSSKK